MNTQEEFRMNNPEVDDAYEYQAEMDMDEARACVMQYDGGEIEQLVEAIQERCAVLATEKRDAYELIITLADANEAHAQRLRSQARVKHMLLGVNV